MNTKKRIDYVIDAENGDTILVLHGGKSVNLTMCVKIQDELVTALESIAEDRAVYAPELQRIARDALA